MLLHTFMKDLNMGRTLYDKLWDAHLVDERDDGSALIYIDRHLIHEVTSPQAFEGLRLQNRLPRRLNANVAVPDHNVSTDPKKGPWQAIRRCRHYQSIAVGDAERKLR